MEIPLHLFLSDKTSFIQSVHESKIDLDSFVIGLVFSCNQKEIQNTERLLEILLLITSQNNEGIKAAAVLKFLVESQKHLKASSKVDPAISELFCKLCKHMSEASFSNPIASIITEEFSRASLEFIQLSSRDDIFAVMLKMILKNKGFIKNQLGLIGQNVLDQIDGLSKFHYLEEMAVFCRLVESTCKALKDINCREMLFISDFIIYRVEVYLKHHQTEDLTEFSEIFNKNKSLFIENQIKSIQRLLPNNSIGSLLLESKTKLQSHGNSLKADELQNSGTEVSIKSLVADPNPSSLSQTDTSKKISLVKVDKKPYTDDPVEPLPQKEKFFDSFNFKEHTNIRKDHNMTKPEEKKRNQNKEGYEKKNYSRKDEKDFIVKKEKKYVEKNKIKSKEDEKNELKAEINQLSSPDEPIGNLAKEAEEKKEIESKVQSEDKPATVSNPPAIKSNQIKIIPKSYEDDDTLPQGPNGEKSEADLKLKPEQELKNLICQFIHEKKRLFQQSGSKVLNELSDELASFERFPSFKKTLYFEINSCLGEDANKHENLEFWEEIAKAAGKFIEKHQVEAIRKNFNEGEVNRGQKYNRRGRGWPKK